MIDGKICILFLSWRDIKSPKSGGAEVHTHGLMTHLDKDKYYPIHFSCYYEGLEKDEVIDGVHYHREGNCLSVILRAVIYYRQHIQNIDFVVDQCNTHRFFSRFWVSRDKRIFYIHQLTREIWDINMRFPLSKILKMMETPMLKLQKNDYTITVSESTKKDLVNVGFDPDKIYLVPNAISESLIGLPLENVNYSETKQFIYVGRYSKYKGIDAAIASLGILKEYYPNSQLLIVGKEDKDVIQTIIKPIVEEYGMSIGYGMERIPFEDVILCGFVSEEIKYELMRSSYALLFPSVREGWGIIVSEAAALGTPSIVYDSPGCVDAVDYGRAGYLCASNTPECLAENMKSCIEDKDRYKLIRKEAYDFVQNLVWSNNVQSFDRMIDHLQDSRE